MQVLVTIPAAGTGFNQKGNNELLKPPESIVFYLKIR